MVGSPPGPPTLLGSDDNTQVALSRGDVFEVVDRAF
jgi:hypothetical protein